METKKTYQQQKAETFNIEKAVNRLEWRFLKENVKVGESKIIINELDQRAVDFLIRWIKQQKEKTLNENIMFSKLFCYSFFHEINFYKGNAKLAQKKMNEIFEMTIDDHFEKVREILNIHQLSNFTEEIGYFNKHPALLNEIEELHNKQVLNQNTEDFKRYLFGYWSAENVNKSLKNTIFDFINKFKNKL